MNLQQIYQQLALSVPKHLFDTGKLVKFKNGDYLYQKHQSFVDCDTNTMYVKYLR